MTTATYVTACGLVVLDGIAEAWIDAVAEVERRPVLYGILWGLSFLGGVWMGIRG